MAFFADIHMYAVQPSMSFPGLVHPPSGFVFGCLPLPPLLRPSGGVPQPLFWTLEFKGIFGRDRREAPSRTALAVQLFRGVTVLLLGTLVPAHHVQGYPHGRLTAL